VERKVKLKRIKEIKRLLETDTIFTRLKKEGDIHIQNVHRFLNKWVEKSSPLRDAIKGIVFGRYVPPSLVTVW
jgi:HD superfamily phosphodiesterase